MSTRPLEPIGSREIPAPLVPREVVHNQPLDRLVQFRPGFSSERLRIHRSDQRSAPRHRIGIICLDDGCGSSDGGFSCQPRFVFP